jgi:RNA polymerase sigma factor (sigma-70 family)
VSDGTPRDAAFDQWCRATYPRTLKRLLNRRRDLSVLDAQEIVQDAYHRVYQNWDRIRDPDGFVWDATKKLTIDHWRKRKSILESPVDASEAFGGKVAPIDGEPEHCVEHSNLLRLINQLPRDYHKVLVMDALGHTTEEQCEALGGVKDGTARVKLSRARKKLEELVKKDEEAQQ